MKTLNERAAVIHKEIIDTKLDYMRKNPKKYMAMMAFNSALGREFDAIAMEKVFMGIDEKLRNSCLGKESRVTNCES